MIDPRLAAALGDRYRLERELGAGGMATVYLADDLKHARKVAVKVLRPDLSATLGHDRFLREITTTANLRHPNILPLFDSGAGAGFLFYVMPFVEGESLRDRLRREPQIPIDEALRIADEVADALSYAHRRGVIHRDIKPENILLENGHAIVADFGIAQAVTSSGDEGPTMTGMVVGTPKYMSPEQARGDVVDERSDLYALGCVVYEMLSGTPPFTGPTAIAVITRHALDPVPSVRTVCPTLAVPVSDAIERALAKTPGERFASVDEWRRALARPTVAAAAPPTPAIFKPPPAPATPLLGRDETLSSAAERLRGGARVLTVTGPGGTGKTRFSIELFRRLQDAYPDGAAFVSIASVTAAAEVMPTVAVALDIAEAHGRSALDAVATVIGNRRVLLLLDNLEQVLDAAGDIAALVSRCPAMQIVVTSRAPLKIAAETELALPPLALPAPDATSVEEIQQSPAVALFVQRAQKVKPPFALSSANGPAVAAIVRRLDGLPLALELAAARIRILEPSALLQRLDRALDLLTSGDRDLPERQRTLRATIQWSHSLLDPAEQRLLRRASVFTEGWTLEAMEAVCYQATERHRGLDELDSLVEKGLVRVVGMGERYLLLETIRAFAAEQLDAAGEADSLRQAHADCFLELAGIVYRDIMGDGAQLDAMRRGRADIANTFAAIQWLTSRARAGDAAALEKGMLLCGCLGWFWHIVGLHLVARGTVDTLLALATDRGLSRGRALARFAGGMVSINTGDMERGFAEWSGALADARALGDAVMVALNAMGMGYIYLSTGRMDEARAALEESIERSRAASNEFLLAFSTAIKGMLHFVTGDLDGGIALVEQARTLQIRLADYEGLGLALSFLAQMHFAKGDHPRALGLYRDAIAAFEVIGDRPELARVQCEFGWTALAHADIAESRRSFQQALRSYDEVGSPRGAGLALMGLAAVDAADGRTERAVRIAAAAHVMSERAGVVVEHPMAPGLSEQIDALKASISRDELDSLVASGRALSPAAVLAMVAD
jgi:predicted ATPase/tRNA A-37 threonylcarbamoyl transferase component Bud32